MVALALALALLFSPSVGTSLKCVLAVRQGPDIGIAKRDGGEYIFDVDKAIVPIILTSELDCSCKKGNTRSSKYIGEKNIK
jgi:hypothetical protein